MQTTATFSPYQQRLGCLLQGTLHPAKCQHLIKTISQCLPVKDYDPDAGKKRTFKTEANAHITMA